MHLLSLMRGVNSIFEQKIVYIVYNRKNLMLMQEYQSNALSLKCMRRVCLWDEWRSIHNNAVGSFFSLFLEAREFQELLLDYLLFQKLPLPTALGIRLYSSHSIRSSHAGLSPSPVTIEIEIRLHCTRTDSYRNRRNRICDARSTAFVTFHIVHIVWK